MIVFKKIETADKILINGKIAMYFRKKRYVLLKHFYANLLF